MMEQIKSKGIVRFTDNKYWKDGESVTLLKGDFSSGPKRIQSLNKWKKHLKSIIIEIPEIPKKGMIYFSYHFAYICIDNEYGAQYFDALILLKYVDEKLMIQYSIYRKDYQPRVDQCTENYWPELVRSENNKIKLTYDSTDRSLHCEFNDLPIFKHLIMGRQYSNSVDIVDITFDIEGCQISTPVELLVRCISENDYISKIFDRQNFFIGLQLIISTCIFVMTTCILVYYGY